MRIRSARELDLRLAGLPGVRWPACCLSAALLASLRGEPKAGARPETWSAMVGSIQDGSGLDVPGCQRWTGEGREQAAPADAGKGKELVRARMPSRVSASLLLESDSGAARRDRR